MITNPYKILGVSDGASEEECTKAYKRLAKKYHPDLNPNDKEAEKKMAEINAAYDQIKNGTQPQGTYSYSTYNQRRSQGASSAPDYLSSAAMLIKSGQYQQALNLLNSIENRNAKWYYLSALANMSLGNRADAEDDIRTAYAKEPDNRVYEQAYRNITSGVNPLNENPFSTFFDFSQQSTPYENRHVYTTKRRGGCLSKILKFIIIIIAIKFIVRLSSFLIGGLFSPSYREYQTPTQNYSEHYGQSNSAEEYFGENSDDTINQ